MGDEDTSRILLKIKTHHRAGHAIQWFDVQRLIEEIERLRAANETCAVRLTRMERRLYNETRRHPSG
jgi:hypothetical protein